MSAVVDGVPLCDLLERTGETWAFAAAEPLRADGTNPVVTSITQDSRAVGSGAVFCALRGSATDGHDYVASAVAAGAAAVVVERHITDEVIEIVVDDSRTATGELAAALYDHPDVALVAVTGTNGKTSVVTLVAHIVNACGGSAASMGTLTGALTTLAAPDFHAELQRHQHDGRTVVAAEVSSHALDQGRISGSRPAVSVFTNLSQDHLDYHDDMQDYFEAKARLFDDAFLAPAVIDVSGEWGAVLAERLAQSTPRTIVAVDGAGHVAGAELSSSSSTFTWRTHQIDLPLGGGFSVINAVLAAEASMLLGYDSGDIAAALAQMPQIPGRFEHVDQGQPFAVIVDYSHTPASIEAAIASARELTDLSLIHI